MVALVRALGGLHLAQQAVHLLHSELAVGAHRAVTRHGGQNFVVRSLHHTAGVMRGEFGQHAARQLYRVALCQRRRHGAYRQRTGTEAGDFQPQRVQRIGGLLCGGDLLRRGGKGGRNQQRLACDTGRLVPLAFESTAAPAVPTRTWWFQGSLLMKRTRAPTATTVTAGTN